MFALAVLLLVAAAALVLWVLFGLNGEHNNNIHFHGFGITADLKPLTVFLLGALTLLLVWAATRLIAAGTKRKYRQHKETKELKKENKLHEKELAEHDRELAIERDRRAKAEQRQFVSEHAGTREVPVEREVPTERDGRTIRD